MASAAQYLAAAEQYLGVPYVFGGESAKGLDCSGLTQLAAADVGISIPRTSEAQWAALPHVEPPLPGDLVFFDVPSDSQAQPAHVGIVTGPDEMINAPYTGTFVRYDQITGPGRIVMGYGRPPFTPPLPPPEEEIMAWLVEYENAFWVVSVDLTSKVKVASPSDGSNLSAMGYKQIALSPAQMAGIPSIG